MDKMKTFYHGTNESYIESILINGIQAEQALKEGSITSQRGLSKWICKDKLKGKTYATSDIEMAKVIAEKTGNPGVVKIEIPVTDIENGTLVLVDNPELLGLSKCDWVNSKIKAGVSNDVEALSQSYDNLNYPNTITIKGDIPSRYIVGRV